MDIWNFVNYSSRYYSDTHGPDIYYKDDNNIIVQPSGNDMEFW